MFGEELDVIIYLHHDFTHVLSLEGEELLVDLQIEQVHILKSASRSNVSSLYLTIDDGALEVEHIFNIFASLGRIRHQKQVHWSDILHLHREHTVDARNKRMWILAQEHKVLGQSFFEDGHLIVVHCFDQEFLVKGKEKEGARLTSRLFGLKHLLPVEFNAQTSTDLLTRYSIHVLNGLEQSRSVLSNGNLFLDDQTFASRCLSRGGGR